MSCDCDKIGGQNRNGVRSRIVHGKLERVPPCWKKTRWSPDLRRSCPRQRAIRREDLKPYETMADGCIAKRVDGRVARRRTSPANPQTLSRKQCAGSGPGQGTGLSGGAMPNAQGVLLSLTKFMRISRSIRWPGCARAAGRAQSGHLGSGCRMTVLRPGPVEPDACHWRQRGRNIRRRALFEVGPDGAQTSQATGITIGG